MKSTLKTIQAQLGPELRDNLFLSKALGDELQDLYYEHRGNRKLAGVRVVKKFYLFDADTGETIASFSLLNPFQVGEGSYIIKYRQDSENLELSFLTVN